MKVGELEASFDDAERVGQKGTGKSWEWRYYKILDGTHARFLEIA